MGVQFSETVVITPEDEFVDVLDFVSRNLVQAIGIAKAQRNAVIQNGVWGDKFSHNCAPIQGIGNERIPKEVPKKPNANPR